MSTGPLGHERQITYFPTNGHNHNGENSTLVDLQPGQVKLNHLDPALLEWLRDLVSGPGGEDSGDFLPVPDLIIETNAIGPGGSITGTVDWTAIAVIRFMRVLMTTDTECTISFYHTSTYADEDREFRSRRCSNKFLWEGPWVHYEEDGNKKIHYKIENTGTQTSRFQLTLKSATLVANGYARFVESLQVQGSSTPSFIGNVLLQAGNGVSITPDPNSNIFRFDVVAPAVLNLDQYGEVPILPVSVSSSTTITYNTGGSTNQLDGITTDATRYATFGTGLQYIQYDFGGIHTATSACIILYYADVRLYNGVLIEFSIDGVNWNTVYGPINTAAVGPPGIRIRTPSAMLTRYVRVWSNGNTVNTNNNIVKCILYAQTNRTAS